MVLNFMKQHDKIAMRLALILQKLNAGERFSIDELVDEFQVSLRTLQRDLNERLSFLPLKVEGKFYSLEDYCLGKLSFEDIRGFSQLSGVKHLFPSLSDAFIVDLLNSKIQQTYKIRGMEHERTSNKENEFKSINISILNHKKLHFIYNDKDRVVHPYKLVNNSGVWYLLADDNGVLKNFTFTKIQNLHLSQETFEVDKNNMQLIDESKTTWFSNEPIEVVLRVDTEIMYYFRRKKMLQNQKIIESQDDYSLLSTSISYDEEILSLVRYWMPHIEIVSPPQLQEKLQNSIKNYLHRHNLSP